METIADQQQAPKLTRAQLKSLTCERVRAVAKGVPADWHRWDYEETHKFKKAMAELRPDNTLPKIVAAAKTVLASYGRAYAEVIPAEAMQ